MRDIKFRAWIKSGFDEDINPYMANVDRLDIIDKTICADENYWNQKNYILMQYTGLKDKNGKEIYEGDITNNGIIRFGDCYEGIGFYLEDLYWCERSGEKHFDTHTLFAFTTPLEVIGNIYENPELIKGELK